MSLPDSHLLREIPLIKGERLYLRELSQQDVSDVYLGWLQDREVLRFLEIRFSSHNRETVSKFVERLHSDDENILFGIFLNDGNLHIGNIKLGPIVWRHRRSEIGIMIGDRASWGKGYATEAIRLLTCFSFDRLGLHKLTAGCLGPNVGSKKAFLKAGFLVEGIRPQYWSFEGGYCENVLMGLIKETAEIRSE